MNYTGNQSMDEKTDPDARRKKRRQVKKDIIGQRFGMITVQSETEPVRDGRGSLVRRFTCICDCGKIRVFNYNILLSGHVNSCGCTHFPKKPPVDLTGKRFGNLTVISETEKHIQKGGKKQRSWNCVCDCGNALTVLQSNLVKPDGTRSCGCRARGGKAGRRRTGSIHDLTGNRYGMLTVLSAADLNKSVRPKHTWLCRCQCGNEVIKEEWNLVSGHTRSCGCMVGNSIKGKTFGLLTAISRVPSSDPMRYWKCRCSCGNEVTVSQDDLFWGTKTDCGCVRKGKHLLDLTGQSFGRLTVLREVEPVITSKGESLRAWLCRCTCGREVVVRQGNLTGKVTRSCGCLKRDKAKKVRPITPPLPQPPS